MAKSFAALRSGIQPGGGSTIFGAFRLDPGARSLTRDGSPVAIGARALDLLIALAARPGEVVSKADLFAAAWPNTSIEESNLRRNIAALRKALGDDRDDNRMIASVAGRGYSLVVPTRPAGHALRAASTVHGALPAALVQIVGRDAVVKELIGRMERGRLVTVTGPGGIGKTAVALAVAHQVADRFHDGARLIDLGALTSGTLIAATLASLLRIPATDTEPLEHVIAHLRRRDMLLMFDNCEHVVDAVSPIVEAILQGAPELHILATSREPLRAVGEAVYRLEPLPLPPPTRELRAEEALASPACCCSPSAPVLATACSC